MPCRVPDDNNKLRLIDGVTRVVYGPDPSSVALSALRGESQPEALDTAWNLRNREVTSLDDWDGEAIPSRDPQRRAGVRPPEGLRQDGVEVCAWRRWPGLLAT